MTDVPGSPQSHITVFQIFANQLWVALNRVAVATATVVEVFEQVSVFKWTTDVATLAELEITHDQALRIRIVWIPLEMRQWFARSDELGQIRITHSVVIERGRRRISPTQTRV